MKPSLVLDCGQDFFRGREKKEINTPRLKGNLLLPHFINKTSYVSLGGHVFPFPLQFPLISLSLACCSRHLTVPPACGSIFPVSSSTISESCFLGASAVPAPFLCTAAISVYFFLSASAAFFWKNHWCNEDATLSDALFRHPI